MMELTKKTYKSIWLSTLDAVPDTARIEFVFNNLPLIQIRGESKMYVSSISVGGEGISDIIDHNLTVKLDNVKYSRTHYFNSDKLSIPTISNFTYSTQNTVQNGGFSLQIEEQDIHSLKLIAYTDSQGTVDSHGLVKNSKDVQLFINLIIESEENI